MDSELEKIQSIINSQDLINLVGLKESLWLEAKNGRAYDLNSAIGRYELAKDVSSFANASGGALIIGLNTEPLIEENTDEIKQLDLMPESDFSSSQYAGVINEYLHPKIQNLVLGWIANKNDTRGVGYIFVPLQDENKKYFLIKNVIEKDNKVREIVFGIAQRIGTSNTPLTIDQLHRQVQRGKSPMAERLTRIEDKIDILMDFSAHPAPKSQVEALNERINEIELED